MKRVIPMLLIMIFLGGLAIVPSVVTVMNNNVDPINFAIPSQNTDLTVRVAIYDEDNTTVPSTGPNPFLTDFSNHLSEIQTLLEAAGHEVTLLTTEDIENHELVLANYDVFLLVNNLPKDSISDLVKEFWLGGGGLLTFDKAFSYLSYKSIIWPDLGIDGYGILWGNLSCDVMNVSARHPTMKDHHVNETISESAGDWAAVSQMVLDNSDVWNYITPLLTNITTPDFMYGFAMDSRWEGGRLVHLPGDGSLIPTDFESIILDSVEWLMPKPKGRIVYDLTHRPRLCVDEWDEEFATGWWSTNNFGQFRTLAVNHSYTFDKLYPSATGNITADRLANYDVLVIDWPDLNYTSAEGVIIEEWVNGGGNLLVLGDRTELLGPNRGDLNINMILQNFDMSLGTSDEVINAVVDPDTHVTLEGCTGLYVGLSNYLSVIGDATPIWSEGTHLFVAAQEFGLGRAILSADMNIFDNSQLYRNSNEQFALNVLNWLTANDAEILVYASSGAYYADVVTALRDLGHPFQLFVTDDYIDDFLDSKSWGLVILDQTTAWFTNTELDAIYAYVNGGGKLIMSYFDVDDTSTHPVWSKIGVEYSSDISGTPEMFIWDQAHRIFTEPNNRNGANFTSNVFFIDDGDTLSVLEGYTALAGSSTTMQDGNAYIVLSNDYQTLYNGYLIDACTSDEDDSTYRDSVELWQNEITFMLIPVSGGFSLDTNTLIIIGVAVLALILIVLLARRRGGSKPKPKKKTSKKKK